MPQIYQVTRSLISGFHEHLDFTCNFIKFTQHDYLLKINDKFVNTDFVRSELYLTVEEATKLNVLEDSEITKDENILKDRLKIAEKYQDWDLDINGYHRNEEIIFDFYGLKLVFNAKDYPEIKDWFNLTYYEPFLQNIETDEEDDGLEVIYNLLKKEVCKTLNIKN
jgi:hypothetical protein